ncbi:MAG TPA: proliferating cell nuclear antigen (pcna) [Candidatus Woesearchaeota archaeon]|nr:proliferating cell nuclear antigen (pcna) [Candidatus Woesearchaeota archaeon]
MFRGVLQDISILKDSLDAISSLITEGTFEVSKDGMKLVSMDPASVAMVILNILPTIFLEYNVDKTQNMTVNLSNLVTILKRARASDTLTLELDDNKLKLKMVGDFKRSFSIPLIDSSISEQKIPSLSFKNKIEIEPSALKDGIKDAAMVSDCVIFETSPDTFTIKSLGDTSETKMELTKDSPSLISLQLTDPMESGDIIKSKYSIDYLDKILKGAKSADQISIQFSTDYPLKVKFTAVNRLQLGFILAPRVDTD